MNTRTIQSIIIGFFALLASSTTLAQRNSEQSKNPFLNRVYWEAKPSISEIESTIEKGHSITEANSGGFDATTFVIFANNPVSTIAYLVANGNDVNKRTHDSRTYVFWAASSGNLDIIKFLINKGARLDVVDSHGYGPISFTAATGQQNTDIYDYFIANGADLKNEKDHQGKNVLLVAIGRAKDFKIVDYLIKKGLSINSVDNFGNGIFHYAAQGGNINILKQLKERGVSIDKNNITDENAIFFASKGREASINLFKYLESLGIHAKVTTKKGENPLHNLAKTTADLNVYKYFVEKGVNPNAIDEEGKTPLLNAAERNKLEAVRYFAEKSTDIDHKDTKGQTALAIAIQNNSADVVDYLISKGADIHTLSKDGNNVAHYLFNSRGKPRDFDAKLSALVKKGFDFKTVQGDGSTIWHLAVAKNNLDLIKKISVFDADINTKDNRGNTPLHYAAMKTEDASILKFLLAKGADSNSTTEFGETAYDLASENELLVKNKIKIDFLN